MEWDHEKILSLINFYAEKPELWNSKNNKYHLKNAKNDAWESIAEKLHCDINAAKSKMVSLLSSFRREKGKMKNSMGTGKGREETYSSKWFAFNSFGFLMDKDKPGRTADTENNIDLDEEIYQEMYPVEEAPQVAVQSVSEEVLGVEETLEARATEGSTEAAKPKKVFYSPRKPQKRKIAEEDPRVGYAFEVLKKLKETPKDECTTYGEHVANKLRKFDENVRAIVMHQINNAIFDAEMGRHNTFVHDHHGTRPNQYASPHSAQSSSTSTSSSLHFSPPYYQSAPNSVQSVGDSPLQDFVQNFTE